MVIWPLVWIASADVEQLALQVGADLDLRVALSDLAVLR
jgi:hypothetical protein